MKTSIRKNYADGFFLSEQDLRRLHQIMVAAAEKISPDDYTTLFYVRLSNGTIVELPSVDDILELDNVGPREIEYLALSVGPRPAKENLEEDEANEEWLLWAKFEKISDYYPSSKAIVFEVRGSTRDWVVLASSELEERVATIRRKSFSSLFKNPATSPMIMLICIVLATTAFLISQRTPPAYLKLESLYQAGQISNAIEALILLERERSAARAPAEAVFAYALSFIIALAIFAFGLPRLVRSVSMPHVFYWGDFQSHYQKRRNLLFVLWTVVFLGIVVGVVSAYISKSLGI